MLKLLIVLELNFMKHRHDDSGEYLYYENVILDKSLSPYIYENDTMNGFLKRLQPLVAILFDHMNIIKNLKNYGLDFQNMGNQQKALSKAN